MIKINKTYFIFISLIIVVLAFVLYKINKEKNFQSEKINEEIISEEKINVNIVEEIKYVSFDNTGNKYTIHASSGEIDSKNINNIFMKNVIAKIIFLNSDVILITSKFAKYDKSSARTLFYDEVKTNYLIHSMTSEELELLFKDKTAIVRNKVVYLNENSKLEADQIILDLDKKKAKIFMKNKDDKVKLKYLN